MRDYEVKGNMTNTGPKKHQPNNEEDLPVVLLHGTSGQSEDWPQVVEQLTSHRPVIRLDYAEPVTVLTRQMRRQYPISQLELWQQPGLVAGIALTLLAFPWEQRLLHSLPRNTRRWFVHWFLYQASVMAVIRE